MSRNHESSRRSFRSGFGGLVLAGALLAGIPPSGAGAQEACWVRGDADGSGAVDLSDAMTILNKLYLLNECVAPAGDANDNGYVTIADTLYILNWAFLGTVSNPPAPFPECGADPTSGTYGFGAPNPDYGILASTPTLVGSRVLYQVKYRSIASLLGLSFGYEIDRGVVVRDVRFQTALPDRSDRAVVTRLPETEFRNQAAIITAVRANPRGGELLPATNWEWVDLGVLIFEFEEATSPGVIRWKPEVDLGGCVYRATMVNGIEAQDPVTDHYPTFVQETELVGFRRGSVGFSEVISYLFEGGEAAVDCNGATNLDAADANDNEAVTLADALKLRANAAGRTGLPAPSLLCGPDPSEDRRGFDQVDASFSMTAGKITVVRGTAGRVTEVHVPISVDIPTPITGVQMIVAYDPVALTPFEAGEGGAFSAVTGRTLIREFEESDRGILIIGIHVEDDDRMLRAADPGNWAQIGTLHFHLTDFAVFKPILWINEIASDGRLYRASLVDADFNDHHPGLLVGEYKFVRGNSSSDGLVDLTDVIFTRDYLFLGGPEPDCLDAADANNDGTIDITDMVYTIAAIFLGGADFPQPFPQCGLDTATIDLLDCNPPTGKNACR
jgi:hypothetical protein